MLTVFIIFSKHQIFQIINRQRLESRNRFKNLINVKKFEKKINLKNNDKNLNTLKYEKNIVLVITKISFKCVFLFIH